VLLDDELELSDLVESGFLSVEPDEIRMGEGAGGENTLVIWAVYAIGGVEVYRVDSIRYYCKSKK